VRIALAQFDVKSGETEANLATAAECVALASQQGAKLIVLLALWSSGYDLENCQMHAQVSQKGVLPALSKLTRLHRLYIVGSVLRANARREVFNSTVLLGPGAGPARIYRKIHPFWPMLENMVSHGGPHNTHLPLAVWCVRFGCLLRPAVPGTLP